MATYLISYFALPPNGLATDGLAAEAVRPGRTISLVPTAPDVLLVDAARDGVVVSLGSPSARAGQVVTLSARIDTMCPAAGGVTLVFDLLELDGIAAGLIAAADPAAQLQTGAGVVTLQLTSVDTTAARRSFPLPRIAPPGFDPSAANKPRRTPLAFALGTRIDTPEGPRPVETLRPGDLISTLGNGSQPLRWLGQRHVLPSEMALREDLRPVRLDSGVLGNGRALMISPRHRVLLDDWRAQVYFGEDEVLVPAQSLINEGTVRQVLPVAGVTYLHLLFDRHEVIVAEGMLSESFHPGLNGLAALDPAERAAIEALFPGQTLDRRPAAFPMLRMAEARALRLPS